MTESQAMELGGLIERARAREGRSIRGLARDIGLSATWLARLERGEFLEPAPDRLARLIEALGIPPRTVERITGNAVSDSLPGIRTYFRTKFDLSPSDAARVEQYVERLRRGASR